VIFGCDDLSETTTLIQVTAAKKLSLISIEDYLKSELLSPVKREYVGGRVYTRADTTNLHNRIGTNWLGIAGTHLRGRRCEVLNSGTKIRIRLATQTRFYYPDGMIVCSSNSPDETFQDTPLVIAEVISEATRRIDEGEKKDAYLTIPSLSAYVLIDTDRPRVVVYRRGADGAFGAELYEQTDSVIDFEDAGCTLRLAELYERVDFTAVHDTNE
jgi:Uma2 family endonuclease